MLGEYAITGGRAADIAASVERGVSSGALLPGVALPPMRELAVELGVNPNTVAAAYRILRERGLIETDGRRGSHVRAKPATLAREAIRTELPPGVRDIATGNPDPALLPSLTEALAAAARRYAGRQGRYGDEPVVPELEDAARAAFGADGLPDGPVALASGALDAIERLLSAHLRPGDAVAVEDPGWAGLLDLIPAMRLKVLPVALDDDGPLPESVAAALGRGARALIVTDRAQNPTGAVLTAERATALRELLAHHPDVLVIDDDHGHAIVHQPLHTLAGATRSWASVRSVAKAYGPDLRLALFTADRVTADRVQGRFQLGPGWVSKLLQYAVVDLWERGTHDTAAVARSYGTRRDALIAALGERGVAARGRSGLNVWVPVADETGAVARLQAAGWAVAPGARFRVASSPAVRLTVSQVDVSEMERLADAVADAVRPGPGTRYA
ncbi:aminotransferase class I/II-fold pyridoxal phosphate-dependent enzyme [Streptomyces sp. NBC_01218]|uniref:aminotransferase class I/II-fold pyridoxal phosphate-dependent enzyme n=1 Tax=Streptomyces sp. NBC_01218 TaxID=2903780 RepID=UPI002E10F254|nr:aminotransferase class I/II-fold pyridoxal phosphate-dependent enzyme [Streptomyces sp. NBC_01218]